MSNANDTNEPKGLCMADNSDALGLKSESVAETKTKYLMDKGMKIVGKVMLKGDDVAIVTDLGRVNWFKAKEIFK